MDYLKAFWKKKTNKQTNKCCYLKKRMQRRKKLQKKIPVVSNVYISLCLARKIPCGILTYCPCKNGWHNFSTFTDFLTFVQFWLFWFYLRALRGISDSVYSYLCMNNLLYGLWSGFGKRKFNRNCIDVVYSGTSRSLLLTIIMWLVLCALNIIDMTFFLLNWRYIKAMI